MDDMMGLDHNLRSHQCSERSLANFGFFPLKLIIKSKKCHMEVNLPLTSSTFPFFLPLVQSMYHGGNGG